MRNYENRPFNSALANRLNDTNFSSNNSKNFAFGLASLDLLFAVLIILIFSPKFWEIAHLILPSSKVLTIPNNFEILQAAILALGFVGIAVKWEIMARMFARFSLVFIALLLAFLSSLWSIDPAQSLKSSIYLFLVFSFSVALGLRFGGAKLANIAIISSFGLLIVQMAFSFGQAADSVFRPEPYEIAFCLVCAFWAIAANSQYAVFYAAIALFCGAIAIFNQDIMGISVLVAIAGAYAIIFFSRLGSGEIVSIAGAIGVLVLLATLYVLGFGEKAMFGFSQLFDTINLRTFIGTGYGLGSENFANYFVDGLGILGLVFAILLVFYAAIIAILNAKSSPANVVAIFGFLALMLINSQNMAVNAPVFMFLIAVITIGLMPARLKHQ